MPYVYPIQIAADMRRFSLQDGAYQLSHRYAISSSAKPPSCQADSFGTPTGLHAIADCIVQQAPLGMVFLKRVQPLENATEKFRLRKAKRI